MQNICLVLRRFNKPECERTIMEGEREVEEGIESIGKRLQLNKNGTDFGALIWPPFNYLLDIC